MFPVGLGRAKVGAVLVVAVLTCLSAAPASAELAQKGNLFIRFDGGLSPNSLPRKALAPIGLRIEGTIRSLSGERPRLNRIRIALNRGGRLTTRGLPVCPRRRLGGTTTVEALQKCDPALVGAGGVVVRTALENQPPTTLRGELLLFNSRVGRRAAILAHVYIANPTPVTARIVFEIRRRQGAFGTVITAQLPASITRNVTLKSIFFQLKRSYRFRGRQRSYLSAACAAPPGFPGATFPFAHATFGFDDGRSLSSLLIRSCRVRR